MHLIGLQLRAIKWEEKSTLKKQKYYLPSPETQASARLQVNDKKLQQSSTL